MGILRVTAVRAALYSLALFVTVASSIIVARRLPPSDYALFQTVVKRVTLAAGYIVGAVGVWAYRAAARRNPAGVAAGFLLASLVSLAAALAGYLLASSLSGSPVAALLSAAATALATLWAMARIVLNAAMPVYAAAATLARRLSYGLLVILFVQLLRLGAAGALAAFAVSQFLVLALAIQRLRRRRLLSASVRVAAREAVSIMRRIYAPALQQLGGLIASLDVVVAYAFSTRLLVAGWFAATNMVAVLVELSGNTLSNLHGYVLATGEYGAALAAARLALAATAPLAAIMIAEPLHFIYLVNHRYYWAAPALRTAALAAPLAVAARAAQQLLEGTTRGPREAKLLARLYLTALLPSSLLYIAAAALGLTLADNISGKAVAWSGAYTLREAALLLLLVAAGRRLPLAKLPLWAAGYTLLAYMAVGAVSLAAPPPPPRTGFFAEAAALSRWAFLSLLVYGAAAVSLDGWLRGLVAQALRRTRRRWSR